MGVITTGQSFLSGQQVTAQKLEDIASNATFTSAIATTDNSTLTLVSGKLKVADTGITATQLADDSVIGSKILDGAVTAAKLDSAAISVLMPTGSIMSFAGAAAPTGYLLCDGAAIARQAGGSNTALFTLLGTTYGAGNGVTTYNIPDLRGRVIAGHGGTLLSGSADAIGATNAHSTKTHTLSTAEMPAHTHGGLTNIDPFGGDGGSAHDPGIHYVTSNGAGTVSGSTGGGGAHNNVQPTFILNYIIKN
tara:strand:- start:928 stop:1674 length:747 start_codon:yes stop_codon:yes gene_type:complete